MQESNSLLALLIVVALVVLTAAAAADPYVCGDANSSGGIDIDDVVFLIGYIFSGGPAPDPACCLSDCPPTVIDYDGNIYFVVEIGDQCWMAENLKVTHYRNGDPIPNVTDNVEWEGLSTGAYCDYYNNPANAPTYGRLYNWYAVDDSRGIAPEGWHVATDDEWKQLEMYLGMSQADADAVEWRGTDEGGKLKLAGIDYWQDPNLGATNETGFTAMPAGHRWPSGDFQNRGLQNYLWSSTELGSVVAAWSRSLRYTHTDVHRYNFDKGHGFSVRCVKD